LSKILYVATISDTINAFFIPHIEMLIQNGHAVDIACNIQKPLKSKFTDMGCNVFNIPFSRSPLSSDNIRAYRLFGEMIKEHGYEIIHTHTPTASAIVRLACRKLRKKGVKVIYTAHGFHFYKGAPLLNWAVYYPIEKLCAYLTDVLITINHEDYDLAKNKLSAGRVEYIPGVGIDLDKFEAGKIDREKKRRELGALPDEIFLLSVGELSKRKNHEVVIKAIAKLRNSNLIYMIAGEGRLKDYLEQLASDLNISNQIRLLGFRTDVAELYQAADVFCLPSLHEGLPVALMEAMASGLPCIVSNIRGSADLIDNNAGGYLVDVNDVNGYADAISKAITNRFDLRMQEYNAEKIKQYGISNIKDKLMKIYSD